MTKKKKRVRNLDSVYRNKLKKKLNEYSTLDEKYAFLDGAEFEINEEKKETMRRKFL